jgi:hypothetical protein
MNSIRIVFLLVVAALVTAICGQTFADPLPGEFAKFAQLPLNGGLPVSITPLPVPVVGTPAPFPGHDELSTAWVNPQVPTTGYVGQYQADDFADNFNTPVVHVQWWGSYMNQSTAGGSVPAFDITFETDVAGDAAAPSHPGSPILNQIVTKGALAPASGTFTETALPVAAGNPDGNLFLNNAELKLPFAETAGTVYWLKIVALDPTHVAADPGRIQWGWHNRDWGLTDPLASPVPVPGEHDEAAVIGDPFGPVWHFQDDAVGGSVSITPAALLPGATADVLQSGFAPENYVLPYDGPPGGVPLSKDLSFVLYTVPEPASVVLFGLGCVALTLKGWRRSRTR